MIIFLCLSSACFMNSEIRVLGLTFSLVFFLPACVGAQAERCTLLYRSYTMYLLTSVLDARKVSLIALTDRSYFSCKKQDAKLYFVNKCFCHILS